MESFSWKLCNVVIVNFQAIRLQAHPLTLWISREHAGTLNSTERAFIACFRWWPMQDGRPSVRNQYVTVETLTEDALGSLCSGGANSSGSNVLLYASQTFIMHYQLDSVDSGILGFKICVVPRPITLSSLTLCSRSEESYHWFEKVDWCTRLLADVCHKPVLCRQGDVCMFPVGKSLSSAAAEGDWETWGRVIGIMFDLTVLECQPVQQGVLGPETTLTVVKEVSLIRHPRIFTGVTEMLSCDAETLDIEDPEMFDECLRTSLIAQPQVLELVTKISLQYFLGHRQTALLNKTLRLLRLAHKCLYSWKARFKIQILAKPPLCPTSKMATKFDVFHVVFATSNTLKKYGFADLSWVVVQLEYAKDKPKLKIDPVKSQGDSGCEDLNLQVSTPRKRCVQVCSIESHWEDIDIFAFGLLQDSVVYMTPLLWFNLNIQPSKLVQEEASLMLQKMTPGQYFKEGSVDGLALHDPLFADELHICLIYTSLQEKHGNCDALLAQFFNLPRYFCQGDVFCLNANEEMNSEPDKELAFHESRCEELIYFYVADIKRKDNVQSLGFLVDRLHTSLYQEAAMQFYVPSSMEQHFSSSSLHPIWHSPLPFGFSNQTAQLTQIVMPYLLSSQLWKTTFPSLCIYGPRACGKTLILKALATQFNLHIYLANCWELIGESSGATIAKLKSIIQKASLCAPCLLVLKNIHTICRDNDGIVGESRVVIALREAISEFLANSNKYPLIFVGTTTDLSLLSPELTTLFLHHFKFEAPTSDERVEIMGILTKDVNSGLQISLKEIAKKTSGFVLGDLCTLTSHAVSTAYQRISKLCDSELLQLSLEEEEGLCLSGIQLLPSDFEVALGKLQAANSDAIGAPKIPNVKWEDIGGLEYAKEEILDTVQLPLQHPELIAAGLRRSGVLLYGPPGTGKTLLAKAVATECSLNFLSVKGPELINMYVGQSEENVRNVFQRARAAAPCIIFFDELDSLAPNRGGSGDSGGVMDRVVSQLLAEIDGLHRSVDVFVMGATNRPDLLDRALLRPGRFDKLLYVRISSDHPSQLKIMKALTRKFHLGNDVNLSDVVEECPTQLTGADFYALCSDAMLRAMSRKIQELDDGKEVDSDIVVEHKDFIDALQNLSPSVSEDDLKRYSVMETTVW